MLALTESFVSWIPFFSIDRSVMVSNYMMSTQKSVIRSNPPGTRAEDFYKWSEQSLEEMDSTLAVQQYIQQLIRRDHTDIDAILHMPAGQDEGVWKYEQLRQFCLELNGLAVRLQAECKPDQCWQMTATDQWIFLCAAHKTPKECTAIDYTRHTLDGAACLLNSNKYFPSRVSIKESSVNKLGSVCRRIYRIFSHAYYHHRQVFDEAENETYLCRRFTSFVTKYELMSRENLIVPIFATTNNDDDDTTAPASGNPDTTATLQRNSGKRSSMVENNFSILKKPPGVGGQQPPFGIAKILNLPAGVVPDDEDDDEEDATGGTGIAELAELNFLSQMPDDCDEDVDIDDDFSFSTGGGGTTPSDFGTLKPMRKAPVLDLNQTVVASGDTGGSEGAKNHQAYLTLATTDDDKVGSPTDAVEGAEGVNSVEMGDTSMDESDC